MTTPTPGNGLEANWRERSIKITGRDTIILLMLGGAFAGLLTINFKAFERLSTQHETVLHLYEEQKCMLALEGPDRLAALPDVCQYAWAKRLDLLQRGLLWPAPPSGGRK